jgi:hypothetical protein
MKRRMKGPLFLFFLCGIGLLFVSIVSANPIPVNPNPPNLSFDGFVLTFIINLPIDFIFLILFAHLFGIVFRSPVSLLAPRKHAFLMVLVTIVVALCGAAIDQLLVALPLYDFEYSTYYPTYRPNLFMDYASVTVALLLIFLSVVLCFHFAYKFKKRMTVMIGVGMLILNIFSWYLYIFLTSI